MYLCAGTSVKFASRKNELDRDATTTAAALASFATVFPPPQEEIFLALFGTGFRGRSSLAQVTAKMGATEVEVLYAGEQPE